jgi:DNA-binding transcriptional MerR regulator
MAKFVCIKEIAQRLGISPRSVSRWSKRVGVPPTIRGYAPNRWSPEDFEKFLQAMDTYGRKHLRKSTTV